jgi:glyoxylase-like metal-dependent hydrolase (beta-lactamase superfamily II)/predicted ester cyclase
MASSTLGTTPQALMTAYFDALTRHDLDAIAAAWAPDGHCHVAGQADAAGPDGVRAYWAELFGAVPDMRFTVDALISEGDQVSVQWSATGTFAGPGSYQGIEPTYARLDLEGLDLFRLRDGQIVREDAYTDGTTFARQIGLLPPSGSSAEQRMARAFNGQAKVRRRALCADPERVAEGVWLVRGGFPLKSMNVYLIEDEGGGVTMFDAGIKAMSTGVSAAAASLGGLNRIVLGHSHGDHRGAAPGLQVPTFCHPAERIDAQGDAGMHYFDFSKVSVPARWTIPRLLPVWDGGPVAIAGTVEEGDDVSGFRVVHIPGHAPGMIALFRESDRVALTTDCFYTLDPGTGRHGAPRVPLYGFNLDTEQARASIRKVAALEPSVAWPGHADPVTGDVRAQLERAASET